MSHWDPQPSEEPAHRAVATKTGARLVLVSAERIHGLADLDAEPLVLVDGIQGLWTAALRQH